MQLEYKLIPAPARADKARGVKPGAARLALTVEAVMNDMAREGWSYLRSDLLPSEERQGLSTRKTTKYHTFLVFQRPVTEEALAPEPPLTTTAPAPVMDAEPEPEPIPETGPEAEDTPLPEAEAASEQEKPQ